MRKFTCTFKISLIIDGQVGQRTDAQAGQIVAERVKATVRKLGLCKGVID